MAIDTPQLYLVISYDQLDAWDALRNHFWVCDASKQTPTEEVLHAGLTWKNAHQMKFT